MRRNRDAYHAPLAIFFRVCFLLWFSVFVHPVVEAFRSPPALSTAMLLGAAVLLTMVAIGVTLSWLYLGRPLLHCVLAWRGASARGRVVDVRHHRWNRGPHHSVRYEFTDPDGRPRRGKEFLRFFDGEQLRPGDVIEVWYVRSWPRLSSPALLCMYARGDEDAERAAAFLGGRPGFEGRVVTRFEPPLANPLDGFRREVRSRLPFGRP